MTSTIAAPGDGAKKNPPVGGKNKNGKPPSPNEGAKKNPVAPVGGTTNDGAAAVALGDIHRDFAARIAESDEARAELAASEAIIERGLWGYVEMGLEYKKIRDMRLYRWSKGTSAQPVTWESYCHQRWGWSASRVRQLIDAAEAALVLKSVTNGNTSGFPELSNLTMPPERVMRELVSIRKDPDAVASAWKRAQAKSPNPEKVSAKTLHDAVQHERRGEQPRRGRKAKAKGTSTGSPAANPVAQSAPIEQSATVGTAPEPIEQAPNLDRGIDARFLDAQIDEMFLDAVDLCILIGKFLPEPNKGPWIREHLLEVHGFDRESVEKAIDFFTTLRQIGDDLKWFAPVAS
jgi:hypothetical protein